MCLYENWNWNVYDLINLLNFFWGSTISVTPGHPISHGVWWKNGIAEFIFALLKPHYLLIPQPHELLILHWERLCRRMKESWCITVSFIRTYFLGTSKYDLLKCKNTTRKCLASEEQSKVMQFLNTAKVWFLKCISCQQSKAI